MASSAAAAALPQSAGNQHPPPNGSAADISLSPKSTSIPPANADHNVNLHPASELTSELRRRTTVNAHKLANASTVSADGYPADDESDDKEKDSDHDHDHDDSYNDSDKHEEATWGKTPSGEVFRVPQTHSFVHTMTKTFTRSSLTRWTVFSLVAQPVLFFLLAGYPTLRSAFFLIYFAFWRGAYDFGFAWLLRQQSENRYIIRTLRQWGWLDEKSESGGGEGRAWARWWKRELEMKMGAGYKWDSVPQEFNSWLIFRQLVDIVLLNDFVSYSLFAWANLNFPANQGVLMHIFRWVFGWSLIVFNLWVKMDAHRVVKDYAWYWGDAFWLMVMQHDLVFDGVYEIAPHPMYSVGYAGYYGLSIVVGSYAVLFVSLAAHAAQFAFLLWFENPHIERTYGGPKKPLAARIPIDLSVPASTASVDEHAVESNFSSVLEASTPGQTEGETETEPEIPELPEHGHGHGHGGLGISGVSAYSGGVDTIDRSLDRERERFRRSRAMSTSIHDLTHRFFRNPVVICKNLDVFRATDFALVVLVAYAIFALVPALPKGVGLAAHFVHALAWRLFHSYGLGLVLRAQSKTRWLVRHYLNNYPYPSDDASDTDEETGADKNVVTRATEEAFQNWQAVYNISVVMTYISFAGLAWKTYHLPFDWTISGTILRHVLGAALIALHVWSATSIYEVLGDFEWFYSDFFLFDKVPSNLAYTGIYRFLNNPERSLGGAAFLGLALISNSVLVFVLAAFSHLSHWWFLSFVEGPHMKQLYGDRLRKDGGLTKTVKTMASKTLNSKTLNSKTSVSNVKRYVDEVRDSIEKVEAKVAETVEGLIENAGPRLHGLANDTMNLLTEAREHMTITRVEKDMSAYDTSRYSITLPSSSTSSTIPRYHVGQPIRVSWTAPSNHSRKDWIGIYRVGASKSKLVTKVSSRGKWVPIFEEEYRGEEQRTVAPEDQVEQGDAGIAVFRGKRLPWAPGMYELRYHHDGKHNVMSIISPIEIYIDKPDPAQMRSYRAVHDTVMNIVCFALEGNAALVPRSARKMAKATRSRSQSQHRRHGSLASSGWGTPVTPVSATDPTFPAHATNAVHSVNSIGGRANSIAGGSGSGTSPPRPAPLAIAELAAEMGSASSDSIPGTPPQDALSDTQLQDADDFVLMDEAQVKHIQQMLEWTYGVELSQDVVIADANVGALAKRILGARNLLDGATPSGTGSATPTEQQQAIRRASTASIPAMSALAQSAHAQLAQAEQEQQETAAGSVSAQA